MQQQAPDDREEDDFTDVSLVASLDNRKRRSDEAAESKSSTRGSVSSSVGAQRSASVTDTLPTTSESATGASVAVLSILGRQSTSAAAAAAAPAPAPGAAAGGGGGGTQAAAGVSWPGNVVVSGSSVTPAFDATKDYRLVIQREMLSTHAKHYLATLHKLVYGVLSQPHSQFMRDAIGRMINKENSFTVVDQAITRFGQQALLYDHQLTHAKAKGQNVGVVISTANTLSSRM